MGQSSVLQLSSSDFSLANGPFFWERDRLDTRGDWNRDQLDVWAGAVTSSFCTKFSLTGSASDSLGDGGVIGVDYTRSDKVIKEVVVFAATSGSGGVSRVDVQTQPYRSYTSYVSIFTNNAFKPALSSSGGDLGIASGSVFVSGSNMVWKAGTLLRAKLDTAAGAAGPSGQRNLTVCVYWVPSGSYGDGR